MGRLLRRDEGRTHQLGVPDARDLSLLKTPLACLDYSDHDRAVLGSRGPRRVPIRGATAGRVRLYREAVVAVVQASNLWSGGGGAAARCLHSRASRASRRSCTQYDVST